MARSTPWVENGVVSPQPHASSALAVGSPAWYAWLEQSRAFAFSHDGDTFTARKEQRRGGQYWYAYRRRQGKLHSAYLGKTEELTAARLEEVAQILAGSAAGGAPGPVPRGTRETAPPAQQSTLLATKLALPPARGTLVPRPGLTERLDAGIQGPLTVISAPPGFGKTTLLQAWRQTESGAARPLAWLALDAADNDPSRFLAYLIAALQTVHDGLGDTALALLQAPHPPAGVAVLTALINDLAGLSRDIALVLDDYHAIETPAVHDAMAFLQEHLPPRVCRRRLSSGRFAGIKV